MSQDSDIPTGVIINLPVAEAGQVAEHPSVGARIRVVSDGTWAGTRVTANGKPVHGVQSVAWDGPRSPQGQAKVYLELIGINVDLEGETDERIVADVGPEQP